MNMCYINELVEIFPKLSMKTIQEHLIIGTTPQPGDSLAYALLEKEIFKKEVWRSDRVACLMLHLRKKFRGCFTEVALSSTSHYQKAYHVLTRAKQIFFFVRIN